MRDTNTILGIDIGGTGTKFALIDTSTGKIIAKAAGWRPQWLGGASSHYRQSRVNLMKRYVRDYPHRAGWSAVFPKT